MGWQRRTTERGVERRKKGLNLSEHPEFFLVSGSWRGGADRGRGGPGVPARRESRARTERLCGQRRVEGSTFFTGAESPLVGRAHSARAGAAGVAGFLSFAATTFIRAQCARSNPDSSDQERWNRLLAIRLRDCGEIRSRGI